jgi:hypothetical protein
MLQNVKMIGWKSFRSSDCVDDLRRRFKAPLSGRMPDLGDLLSQSKKVLLKHFFYSSHSNWLKFTNIN